MSISFFSPSDPLTIASALRKIEELRGKSLISVGKWTPVQIISHCTQSVRYSMSFSGYPDSRPEIFQKTLGKLIFSVFARKKFMKHPLDDPIPGAPFLQVNRTIEEVLGELKQAYRDFDNYTGPLAPHFTYGVLTKEEYQLAHVMHLNNHLENIKVY